MADGGAAKKPQNEPVSMDTFWRWREGCRVRKIQAKYKELQKAAREHGCTEQVEMNKSYKDFTAFALDCEQFDLLCWPSELAELGSGTVLYFHLLAFLGSMMLLFFVMQVPIMAVYGGEDWAGYDSWRWISTEQAFFDSSACECAGTNHGFGSDPTIGITCGAWDVNRIAECQGEDRPQWCCRSWCFADEHCASGPDQDQAYLSNVRVNQNWNIMVAATTECPQTGTDVCTGANVAASYPDNAVANDYDKFFLYTITPGSYGPDQAEAGWIPSFYVAILVLLVLGLITVYQHFLSMNTKIDIKTTHPNDFAIMVTGLPTTATDESVIQKWFQENALRDKKNAEIVKVVIGWDAPQFREIRGQIKELNDKRNKLDPTSPEVKEITQQMQKLSQQLQSAAPDTAAALRSSGNVVIVFRFQADLRACLKRWTSLRAKWLYTEGEGCSMGDPLPMFTEGDNVCQLRVRRAPNPGDIQWEELGVPWEERYKLMLWTNSIMAGVVIVSGCIVFGLRRLQIFMDEEDVSGATFFSLLPALTIGITNGIVSHMAVRLGTKEFHETFTSEQLSIATKMTVGLTLNTSAVWFFVNLEPEDWYKDTGLASSIFLILALTSIIPPLIQLLDLKQRILYWKRRNLNDEKIAEWNQVIQGPPPKSAEDAKKRKEVNTQVEMFKRLFEPTDIRVPRRYANAMKTFISCTVYMPLLPITPLIGVVALALQYTLDKYLILRCYKRPARPSNADLPKGALSLLKSITPIMLSVSFWVFLTPSFAEKGSVLALFTVAIGISLVVAFTPVSVLRTLLGCRLLMKRLVYEEPQEGHEDYYKVQYMWPKEMKYHKDQFLYKLLPEAKNPEHLSPETEKLKVEEMKASIGAGAGAALLASAAAAGVIGGGAGTTATPDGAIAESPEAAVESPAADAAGDGAAETAGDSPPTDTVADVPVGSGAPPVVSSGKVPPTVYGAAEAEPASADAAEEASGPPVPTVYGASAEAADEEAAATPADEPEAAAADEGGSPATAPLLEEAAAAGAAGAVAGKAHGKGKGDKDGKGKGDKDGKGKGDKDGKDKGEKDGKGKGEKDGKGKGDKDGKGKGKDGKDGKKKRGGTWEFETGRGFTAFNADCQDYIEKRYQEFVAGGGRARINVSTAGDGGAQITISLDFEKMTSKVENSKTVRKIRRSEDH